MTVGKLRALLEGFGDDSLIMMLDGANGGGCPRDINLGPCLHQITEEESTNSDDCEMMAGKTVVVVGYGCY